MQQDVDAISQKTISDLSLPRRSRGRQSSEAEAKYQAELERFCAAIRQINSTLDFRVSSRGWCYVLEEHGLAKGDFDTAQKLINTCRKSGLLPLNICSEDEGRQAEHLEDIDNESPEEFAQGWIDYVCTSVHKQYNPVSFWDFQNVYIQMTVEKIDLKSLFSPVCKEFHVPLINVSGWNDINSRAAMMRRFAHWEGKGKRCVLLHCGDHDPGGLHISDFIRSNMKQLRTVDWSPDNLTIKRFGLNADFINRHRLTWIDNLETGSGGRLDDEDHNDHSKPYVQDYIKQFGARKCEANALVVRAEAGRKLCRDTILKYIKLSQVRKYESKLKVKRSAVLAEINRLVASP